MRRASPASTSRASPGAVASEPQRPTNAAARVDSRRRVAAGDDAASAHAADSARGIAVRPAARARPRNDSSGWRFFAQRIRVFVAAQRRPASPPPQRRSRRSSERRARSGSARRKAKDPVDARGLGPPSRPRSGAPRPRLARATRARPRLARPTAVAARALLNCRSPAATRNGRRVHRWPPRSSRASRTARRLALPRGDDQPPCATRFPRLADKPAESGGLRALGWIAGKATLAGRRPARAAASQVARVFRVGGATR